MGKYTQVGRPLRIETLLGPDVLLLEKLAGREAISELFHFDLSLLAEQPVPVDHLVGQPVTLRWQASGVSPRLVRGIVRRFERVGRVAGPEGPRTFIRYRAVVVPRLWLLTLRVRQRIFQNVTVPEILESVLRNDWEMPYKFDAVGTFPTRTYTVQYGESDFAFLSRLMEDAGIYYFFQDGDEEQHLQLSNRKVSHPPLSEPVAVAYDDVEGGKRDGPRVWTWCDAQELGTAQYSVRDYHFQLPKQNLAGSATLADEVMVGRQSRRLNQQVNINGKDMLCHDDYPVYGRRFDGIDSAGNDQPDVLPRHYDIHRHLARIRMEQEGVRCLNIQGTSNCGHFEPGYRFDLEKHGDADGGYLLAAVEHAISLEGTYTSGGEQTFAYENRFRVHPASSAFVPARRARKPVMAGPQTAVVVGPAGEAVFVDKFGRVKVRFHWDPRDTQDAESSCWIRVGQTWAGKRYGGFFWPRIGHEVIVDFEDGDPDRPIIIGSVYNAENMPPLDLPAAAFTTGFKSCSINGDPLTQYNCVMFHDEAGKEHVQIHSENHALITSETTHCTQSPGPMVEFVGHWPQHQGSGSGGGLTSVLHLAGQITQIGDNQGWWDTSGKLLDWWDNLFPGRASYCLGESVNAVIGGGRWAQVYGCDVKYVFDPVGILWDEIEGFGPLGVALSWFCNLGPTLIGDYGFTLGQKCTQTYVGPKIDITRCATWTAKGDFGFKDLNSSAVTLLTMALAAWNLVMDVAIVAMAGSDADRADMPANNWAMMLSNLISNDLSGILLIIEETEATLQAAKAKLDAAQAELKKAEKVLDSLMTLAEDALVVTVRSGLKAQIDNMKSIMDNFVLSSEACAKDLEAAVKSLAGSLGGADQNTRYKESHTMRGNHAFQAYGFDFNARKPADQAGSASVNLRGFGTGDPATVTVDGRGLIDINAGAGTLCNLHASAGISLLTEADNAGINVVAASGPISLCAGSALEGPPRLDMTNEKLELAFGLPGVGASIKLTNAGIELSFGVNKVVIGPAGITLESMTGLVEIAGADITISATADITLFAIGAINQAALESSVEVGGEANVVVPMNIIE